MICYSEPFWRYRHLAIVYCYNSHR